MRPKAGVQYNSRLSRLAATARICMKKKVFIRTFGCQMNEYDSDKMADVLSAAEGMEKTDKVEEADVILFNTCSVRERAQEKVFHDLGRVRELKKEKPDLAWAAVWRPRKARRFCRGRRMSTSCLARRLCIACPS